MSASTIKSVLKTAAAQGPLLPIALAKDVVRIDKRVLPALAPNTIQSAASKLKTPDIAMEEAMMTAARLETQSTASSIPAAKDKIRWSWRSSKKGAKSALERSGAVEITI